MNKGMMFGVHLRAASEKGERLMSALSGLMPNVGGPREGHKRLLVSVVKSIFLPPVVDGRSSEFSVTSGHPKA